VHLSRIMPIKRVALLALCSLTSACYTGVPITTSTIAPDARLELKLTNRGTAELEQTIGAGIGSLQARFVSSDSAEFVVSVLEVKTRSGFVTVWSGERVAIARQRVDEVLLRRLDVPRTALAVAVVGAGAAAMIGTTRLLNTGFTPDTIGDGPPAQTSKGVPTVLRLPLRWP